MEYQLSIYGVVELVISVFVLCVQSPSKVTKRTSVLSSLTVTASKCETKHKLCHLWQLTGDQKKLAKLQKASFGCLVSGRYIQSQREHADLSLSLSLFCVYMCVCVCGVRVGPGEVLVPLKSLFNINCNSQDQTFTDVQTVPLTGLRRSDIFD